MAFIYSLYENILYAYLISDIGYMFSCAQLAGGCIRAPPSERSTHAAHAKVSLKLNLVEEEVEMEDKRPLPPPPENEQAAEHLFLILISIWFLICDLRFFRFDLFLSYGADNQKQKQK